MLAKIDSALSQAEAFIAKKKNEEALKLLHEIKLMLAEEPSADFSRYDLLRVKNFINDAQDQFEGCNKLLKAHHFRKVARILLNLNEGIIKAKKICDQQLIKESSRPFADLYDQLIALEIRAIEGRIIFVNSLINQIRASIEEVKNIPSSEVTKQCSLLEFIYNHLRILDYLKLEGMHHTEPQEKEIHVLEIEFKMQRVSYAVSYAYLLLETIQKEFNTHSFFKSAISLKNLTSILNAIERDAESLNQSHMLPETQHSALIDLRSQAKQWGACLNSSMPLFFTPPTSMTDTNQAFSPSSLTTPK